MAISRIMKEGNEKIKIHFSFVFYQLGLTKKLQTKNP